MDKFDSLKSIVDKLDVDKLVPAPINLKKFKDLVDTSGLVRNRLWC